VLLFCCLPLNAVARALHARVKIAACQLRRLQNAACNAAATKCRVQRGGYEMPRATRRLLGIKGLIGPVAAEDFAHVVSGLAEGDILDEEVEVA